MFIPIVEMDLGSIVLEWLKAFIFVIMAALVAATRFAVKFSHQMIQGKLTAFFIVFHCRWGYPFDDALNIAIKLIQKKRFPLFTYGDVCRDSSCCSLLGPFE